MDDILRTANSILLGRALSLLSEDERVEHESAAVCRCDTALMADSYERLKKLGFFLWENLQQHKL